MSIYDPPAPPEDKAAENAEDAAAESAWVMTSNLQKLVSLSIYDCYWEHIFGEVLEIGTDGDVAEYEFELSAKLRGSPHEQDGLALGALLRRLADLVEGGV